MAGNTYWGSTLTTITTTDNPNYTVGQILSGWYTYVSPTIDGVFLAAADQGNLKFAIGYPTKPGTTANLLTQCAFPRLVVSNGAVSVVKFDLEGLLGEYRFFGHVTLPVGQFDGFRIEMVKASEYGQTGANYFRSSGAVAFGQPVLGSTSIHPAAPTNLRVRSD